MIAALKGKPIISSEEAIILMTKGVGYQVYLPSSLKEKLRGREEAFLFIHTHVRSEVLELYGFEKKEELFLFKLLLRVPGVGPKTALTIVDQGIENVQEAVVRADISFFTLIPKIGKKSAQKIIIELKGKLGSLAELDLMGEETGETKQLIEALVSMGFSQKEVSGALRKLPKNLGTVEEKIRYALRNLGK